MTGTLLFLGLGMQEILFIALMNGVEEDIDGKDKKGETKE